MTDVEAFEQVSSRYRMCIGHVAVQEASLRTSLDHFDYKVVFIGRNLF